MTARESMAGQRAAGGAGGPWSGPSRAPGSGGGGMQPAGRPGKPLPAGPGWSRYDSDDNSDGAAADAQVDSDGAAADAKCAAALR